MVQSLRSYSWSPWPPLPPTPLAPTRCIWTLLESPRPPILDFHGLRRSLAWIHLRTSDLCPLYIHKMVATRRCLTCTIARTTWNSPNKFFHRSKDWHLILESDNTRCSARTGWDKASSPKTQKQGLQSIVSTSILLKPLFLHKPTALQLVINSVWWWSHTRNTLIDSQRLLN